MILFAKGAEESLTMSDYDEVVQAICNFCGGQLERLEVNPMNPYAYRCRKCGKYPSTPDPPPVQSKLAMSYNVMPKFNKSEDKL